MQQAAAGDIPSVEIEREQNAALRSVYVEDPRLRSIKDKPTLFRRLTQDSPLLGFGRRNLLSNGELHNARSPSKVEER